LQERENEMFARMGEENLGVNAETVHRDKAGKRMDPKLEKILRREREQKEAEELEKQAKWGKG
jgi:pre-mRNA-splicing factor CWC26